MIKILHWLFGWDYILFSYGLTTMYRKIRTFPNGIKYVKCYGDMFIIKDDNYLVGFNNEKRAYTKITGVRNDKQN